ncbi:hypothetical protein E4U43_003485 [Claviceps pusilla]|uniref:Uncharacterized protein n=1 Tax=Claviceps pusilla TaxID=123648 RepID=A0A9P7N6R8_9HYPO|nr:hypothetical protein E4U43_003485 [Claviceps pusilla]
MAAQGSAAREPNHNGTMASQHHVPAAGSTQQNAQHPHASTTSSNGISTSQAQQERNPDHQKDDVTFAHIGAQFTQ